MLAAYYEISFRAVALSGVVVLIALVGAFWMVFRGRD